MCQSNSAWVLSTLVPNVETYWGKTWTGDPFDTGNAILSLDNPYMIKGWKS